MSNRGATPLQHGVVRALVHEAAQGHGQWREEATQEEREQFLQHTAKLITELELLLERAKNDPLSIAAVELSYISVGELQQDDEEKWGVQTTSMFTGARNGGRAGAALMSENEHNPVVLGCVELYLAKKAFEQFESALRSSVTTDEPKH